MTPIPDDIMRKARDLAHVGCGCEDVDEAEFSCEHFRKGYCLRAADHIARAFMDERQRCAAIVLKIHPHTNINTDLHKAREEIAAAILKGEA